MTRHSDRSDGVRNDTSPASTAISLTGAPTPCLLRANIAARSLWRRRDPWPKRRHISASDISCNIPARRMSVPRGSRKRLQKNRAGFTLSIHTPMPSKRRSSTVRCMAHPEMRNSSRARASSSSRRLAVRRRSSGEPSMRFSSVRFSRNLPTTLFISDRIRLLVSGRRPLRVQNSS